VHHLARAVWSSNLVGLGIDIRPNSDGLPGIGQLRSIVGASMTIGLILAVLALIMSAIVWALGGRTPPTLTSPGGASSASWSRWGRRSSAARRWRW
jgi:hypothetical protein